MLIVPLPRFQSVKKGIDLPAGIMSGQHVYTYLSRLTWHVHGAQDFSQFPIPFAAIATDIETGEAIVFNSGYLPDALRASISIPSVFAPHKIDGKMYIDGGLIRNIPVQDAIDMGANYTIAVDVSIPLMPQDSLNTLSSILNQTIYYRIQEYSTPQRELADHLITIDELHNYTTADFNLAERFLEIGQRYGQKNLEKFREIAAMQSIPPPPRPGVGDPGSHPISNIIIEGNTIFDDEYIIRQLNFTPGTSLNPDIIEEKVSMLYSSSYINNVTYRLIPADGYHYTLQINIAENTTDDFRVGLRYESETQASILLEGNFQNLLHKGSLTRGEARLGDQLNFMVDHLYYGALGSHLALLTSFQYLSENVDWFDMEGERVSRFKNEVIRGELSAANYFGTQNMLAAGIRKDFTYHTDRINPEQIGASSSDYHALFLRFIRDNFNRRGYPTRGDRVITEGFISDEFLLSPINFISGKLYYRGFYDFTDYLSLTNSFWATYSSGDDLPWHYWSSPNRFDPVFNYIQFPGADRFELNSRNVQVASLGLQAEPFYHRFIGVEFYAGRFLNQWNLDFSENDIEYGTSLTVGAQTILGPLKLILSHSTLSSFGAEIQIGYQF
jgi:NTE family protein